MATLTIDSSVSDWAAQSPVTIPVLEAHGIDYCCHGDVPLAIACEAAGITPERLLDEFQQAACLGRAEDGDWLSAPLAELCDHIERTHHMFLREQLPRLALMIDKVVAAHADRHPELQGVRRTFHELRAELEPHMLKEERILFPAIRALEHGPSGPVFPFGSVWPAPRTAPCSMGCTIWKATCTGIFTRRTTSSFGGPPSLREHLAWWAPALARLLGREAPGGYYETVGVFLTAWLPAERAVLGVPPFLGRVEPSQVERPEECEGCALAT